MTIFNIDHFLEIHQEIKGLTKLLMINLDYINSKNIIKIIFISNGLKNFIYQKKQITLFYMMHVKYVIFIKKNHQKLLKIFIILEVFIKEEV